MPKSTAVLTPNLGLVYNRPPIALPAGAVSAGFNFRIGDGKISNLNLGWDRFGDFTLNGTVLLISQFVSRSNVTILIFATPTDLYQYHTALETVTFLTPAYTTGTVDVSAAPAAVVTAASGSPTWDTAGVKAGDQISFGSAVDTDPASTWYTVDTVDSETQLTLIGAVAGAPLTGSTYTIRQLFSGDQDNIWEAVMFLHEADGDEDWWIATNGIDDVVYWNGTTTFASSLGLSVKANHLATYKNMLILTAVTAGGQFFPARMMNSDIGNPDDFSGGVSEIFTVHGGPDEVTRAMPLGDSLALYSAEHIIMADFVGDPYIFAFRTAATGLGPLAGMLVADRHDTHEFLGADTAYRFDGTTVAEHGAQIMGQVLSQRSPNKITRGYVHLNDEVGDLLWIIPLTSDMGEGPEIAWVEHYLEDTALKGWVPFSVRDFPFTATGYFTRQARLTWDQLTGMWQELNFRWNDSFFEAAFPFSLAGDVDGKLYTLNTAQSGDGTPLASYIRFGRRPTADGRMRAMLARVYPFASVFPDTTLLVRTRMTDSALGDVEFTDEQEFSTALLQGGHFVSVFRAGRFWELEFATAGDPWELSGYDHDMRPGGRR